MTNFSITAFDDEGTPIMTAYTTYFSDAVTIAAQFANSDIVDFHTGEVLRVYKDNEIEYAI